MFKKLLLLSFIVTVVPTHSIDSVIEKVEKKVDIIVDNIFDLADILFTSPEIDKIDLEKEFILLLDRQAKKIEAKRRERNIDEKVSQQDFVNRFNKFMSFAEKLGFVALKKIEKKINKRYE